MKPAPFTYHRPRSVEEAVALLAQVADEDGRVLAGGQSLLPMMALRVAYPGHLVDINGIPDLERVQVAGDELVVGALARHGYFHRGAVPGRLGALLAEVAGHIAHHPIRMRGTFCGSLAHADPASEWCLVAATLNATLVAQSSAQRREIPVQEYFAGAMATALEPEELLVEARLPMLGADERYGFYEFNRRAGDFALGMSLVTLRLEAGMVVEARIGTGGVEDNPRRQIEAEAELLEREPTPKVLEAAAEAAAAAIVPLEDAQISEHYRRDLARVAVRRALEQALSDSALVA